MNREDIIRMAREAGLWIGSEEVLAKVERFAELVRQDEQIRQMKNAEELAELVRRDERKACAEIAAWRSWQPMQPFRSMPSDRTMGRIEGERYSSKRIADAIRARGEA